MAKLRVIPVLLAVSAAARSIEFKVAFGKPSRSPIIRIWIFSSLRIGRYLL